MRQSGLSQRRLLALHPLPAGAGYGAQGGGGAVPMAGAGAFSPSGRAQEAYPLLFRCLRAARNAIPWTYRT